MDRFIAASESVSLPALPSLKSNMDRFIGKIISYITIRIIL